MNKRKFKYIRTKAWNATEKKLQEHFHPAGNVTPAHLASKITDAVLKSIGVMCKETECQEPSRARGYCTKHYQQKYVIRNLREDKERDEEI